MSDSKKKPKAMPILSHYADLQQLQKQIRKIIYDKDIAEECNKTGYINLHNPATIFAERATEGKYDELSDDDYRKMLAKVEKAAASWHDKEYIYCNYQAEHISLMRALLEVDSALTTLLAVDKALTEADISTSNISKWLDDMDSQYQSKDK